MRTHSLAPLKVWAAAAGVLVLGSAHLSKGVAAPENIGTVRQGLVGGREVTVPEQERLGLLTMSGAGSCSGSLLRNDWVITAAHCVETDDAKGDPIPDPDRPGQNKLVPVSKIKWTAAWGNQTQTAVRIETFRPYDVAIIQLFDPIKVNNRSVGFVRQIYQGNRKGIEIRVYGRGLSKFASGTGESAVPGETDGKYRVARATITDDGSRKFTYEPKDGASTAGGDSGGPSLTGNDELVGVGSSAKVEYVPGKPETWKWATNTTDDKDAPVAPVWSNIARIMGPVPPSNTPEPPPPPEPVFRYTVPIGVGTAGSHFYLYGVGAEDGLLYWHEHNINPGSRRPHAWAARSTVGNGWKVGYKNHLSGGAGVIYAIADDGTMGWHRHMGMVNGKYHWVEPSKNLGGGWDKYYRLASMGDGVMYGVKGDGVLYWRKLNNYLSGIGTWSEEVPVGWGWDVKHIFAGGKGILYTVGNDGTLRWHQHKEYLDNPPRAPINLPSALRPATVKALQLKWQRSWAGESKKVGDGWGNLTQIFSPGEGHIYAVTESGDLMYYRHLGWETGEYRWDENIKGKIAEGWNSYAMIFAALEYTDYNPDAPK